MISKYQNRNGHKKIVTKTKFQLNNNEKLTSVEVKKLLDPKFQHNIENFNENL